MDMVTVMDIVMVMVMDMEIGRWAWYLSEVE